MKPAVLFGSVLFLGTLACSSLQAQSPTPTPAPSIDTGGKVAPRSYLPADFARFAPRTALDMLRQVPGFTIRQEEQERGLGQATGNVVINGQRISGKSNDVITELGRVSAQNVERIDIVDGAALDVPGLSGAVANVIVKSTGISGQFAYRPEFRSHNTDPLLTRFESSVSGSAGRVDYTIGLDNRSSRSGASGPTWIHDSQGNIVEERDDLWTGDLEQPRVSGKFVFKGPGDSIANLNLSYLRFLYDYTETGTRPTPGIADRFRNVTVEEDSDNYEIGGDYAFDLGPGQLKLIGLARAWHIPAETNLSTSFADRSPSTGSRFAQVADEDETIGRAEYRWKAVGGEWQVSSEGAFNSLDNTSRLFVMLENGLLEEVPLPGSTARVEEERYEVMTSYGRSVRPDLTMKLSLGGEYSELAQVGGQGRTRDFYRPKGELTAAWQASPRSDFNFTLARRVGQLNFFDFLSSVNLRDDIETAANPDLVPQQSWELDVEGVRKMGPVGTTTLRLYTRLIDDIIDFIPIGESGQSPGNLESAWVYGVESRSTFNLEAFRFPGARLDALIRLQDSEVKDPLTGDHRRISNSLMQSASLTFRHDVPTTEWAWGGGMRYQLNALSYRLTEVGRLTEGPVWADLFLEHKNILGLTVRAGVNNIAGARSVWDRTVYEGRRTGEIAFVEERDRLIGLIFSFAIRGKL